MELLQGRESLVRRGALPLGPSPTSKPSPNSEPNSDPNPDPNPNSHLSPNSNPNSNPDQDFQRFTYLLTAAEDAPVAGFESFLVARGFSRVQLWPPALLTEPKVRVLKRKTVREDARAKPSGDYML